MATELEAFKDRQRGNVFLALNISKIFDKLGYGPIIDEYRAYLSETQKVPAKTINEIVNKIKKESEPIPVKGRPRSVDVAKLSRQEKIKELRAQCQAAKAASAFGYYY